MRLDGTDGRVATCRGLPMVQTRLTGSALTDKVVFNAAGYPVRPCWALLLAPVAYSFLAWFVGRRTVIMQTRPGSILVSTATVR